MGCLVAENQVLAWIAYLCKGAVVWCWVGALAHCQPRSDTCRKHFSPCRGDGLLKELRGPGDPSASRCVARGGTACRCAGSYSAAAGLGARASRSRQPAGPSRHAAEPSRRRPKPALSREAAPRAPTQSDSEARQEAPCHIRDTAPVILGHGLRARPHQKGGEAGGFAKYAALRI